MDRKTELIELFLTLSVQDKKDVIDYIKRSKEEQPK